MYTIRHTKNDHRVCVMAVLALLALPMLIFAIPSSSADDIAYAQSDDISVSPSIDKLTINAGDSETVYLDIRNLLPYSAEDPNTLVIYVYFTNTEDITVTFPGENGQRVEVDGQKIGNCEMLISVDAYAKSTDHNLSFDIRINDPDRGNPIRADASDLIRIDVKSILSSGASYNKILGIFENKFPGVFGTPLASAILSFIVFFVFAVIIAFYIVPCVMQMVERIKFRAEERKRESKEARHDE